MLTSEKYYNLCLETANLSILGAFEVDVAICAVFWRGVCGGGERILEDGFPISLAWASFTPKQ